MVACKKSNRKYKRFLGKKIVKLSDIYEEVHCFSGQYDRLNYHPQLFAPSVNRMKHPCVLVIFPLWVECSS